VDADELIMSKLYVGNLPTDVNEGTLRQLFQDHSLSCTTILVKRGGYAFVECTDQSTADRAIDKLNGEYIFVVFHDVIKQCNVWNLLNFSVS
jgi:RNA recognition motif-containing protein